jgi:hypothetical protein
MSEPRRTLSDQLDKAFDMEFSSLMVAGGSEFPESEEHRQPREERVIDTSEIDIPEDELEYAKRNMIHLISKGMSAFADMADIARSTEKFGAFETLNSMMKNLADMNQQFLELEKKSGKQLTNPTTATTNNNIFVGNAMDVMKLLSTANIDSIEGEFE